MKIEAITIAKRDTPEKVNIGELRVAIEAVAPGARVEYLPARSETRPDGQGGYFDPVFLDAKIKIEGENVDQEKLLQVLRNHKPAKTEDEERRDAYLQDFANRIFEALQLLKADGRLNSLLAPGMGNDATKR
jgi:hypothetical protein